MIMVRALGKSGSIYCRTDIHLLFDGSVTMFKTADRRRKMDGEEKDAGPGGTIDIDPPPDSTLKRRKTDESQMNTDDTDP